MMLFAVIIIFALFASFSYYISRRLYSSQKYRFPHLKRWHISSVLFALCGVMALAFASFRLSLPSFLGEAVAFVGFCWMGIFLYLLLYTLALDGVFLLGRALRAGWAKSEKGAFVRGICVLSLTLVTAVYGFCNARCIKIADYDISAFENGENLRIVMVSDVHLGSVGSEGRLSQMVNEINALKPDVVCIAGDFFDSDFQAISDPQGSKAELLKLESRYGVYMCPGNHDAGETAKDMNAFAEECNIKVLNDSYTVIEDRIVLAGRLDRSPIGNYLGDERKELSEVLEGAPKELFTVVMDHNPIGADTYEESADLVLCGHTHKGQLFPGSIITDLMYPQDHGYYRANEKAPQFIVSQGFGYWGIPMRVGTHSEIVCIDLVSNN